jgi:hypothetical protein
VFIRINLLGIWFAKVVNLCKSTVKFCKGWAIRDASSGTNRQNIWDYQDCGWAANAWLKALESIVKMNRDESGASYCGPA